MGGDGALFVESGRVVSATAAGDWLGRVVVETVD
jgi:hypothetical protein